MLLYAHCTGRTLAERGVFFYDYFYKVPRAETNFGRLKPLPLPSINSPEWPIPTAETSECFRVKLYSEIQKCLRPSVASRQVRISVFMPLHIFVDFFHDEEVRKTMSMFLCKSETCLDFLDQNWDNSLTNGIFCKVEKKSIVCKSMIATQNFIISFYYMRWHYVEGQTVAIDQDLTEDHDNPFILLEVWIDEVLFTVLNVRANVTLRQVRWDLKNEVDIEIPEDYTFECNGRKVGTINLY